MSIEKRFRRCIDPCQHFLTPDDTHDLCVMCLGEEHACSVLEGCPFSRENWGNHLPPAARIQPLLRQR